MASGPFYCFFALYRQRRRLSRHIVEECHDLESSLGANSSTELPCSSNKHVTRIIRPFYPLNDK